MSLSTCLHHFVNESSMEQWSEGRQTISLSKELRKAVENVAECWVLERKGSSIVFFFPSVSQWKLFAVLKNKENFELHRDAIAPCLCSYNEDFNLDNILTTCAIRIAIYSSFHLDLKLDRCIMENLNVNKAERRYSAKTLKHPTHQFPLQNGFKIR